LFGQDLGSGLAILARLSPYFEAMECYRRGRRSTKNESTEFLIAGLMRVAGVTREDAGLYAGEIRNGLAHEWMFRRAVISHYPDDGRTIGRRADGVLVVNPWLLLDEATDDFRHYVEELRSGRSPDLRQKFDSFMALEQGGHKDRKPKGR
jgi:hypothetical protein